MNQSIQIGPLALPLSLVLLALAVIIALLVAGRMARKSGLDAEGPVYKILLVGLLVARLAFVYQFSTVYLNAPWTILDIRDGGWNAPAGLIGAWLYAMTLTRRVAALRRPLLSALALASVVWGAGMLWLTVSMPDARPLPEFTAASIDDRQVALPAFKGKPTVINLWATWCPPCRREMPALEQAQKDHPDVNFVFLNQGESPAKVRQFLDGNRLALHNVLFDPKREVARLFNQSALPTTLFFDADGHLAGIRVGELSQATIAHRLGALAPGKAATGR
ncbi:MAG: TlpA family protein disulfide reductase [Burkholderiales bacterium]|nr:TlpA family protein disulfide reductase [Burkholderiales bacterium]